jgi:hypothetical protein
VDAGIGLAAISWLDAQMQQLVSTPGEPENIPLMEEMTHTLRILHGLPMLQLDIWRSQNMHFRLRKQVGNLMHDRARNGDDEAKKWIDAFRELGLHLRIKVKDEVQEAIK